MGEGDAWQIERLGILGNVFSCYTYVTPVSKRHRTSKNTNIQENLQIGAPDKRYFTIFLTYYFILLLLLTNIIKIVALMEH